MRTTAVSSLMLYDRGASAMRDEQREGSPAPSPRLDLAVQRAPGATELEVVSRGFYSSST